MRKHPSSALAGNNSWDGDVNVGDGRNLAWDVVVVVAAAVAAVAVAVVAAVVGLTGDHFLQAPS